MENLVWYLTMIPCSALLTGFGIYAWNRKKPMWFWAGSTVAESEISDVAAYNRANGAMWIVYSLLLWAATFAGSPLALILVVLSVVPGLPLLVVVYRRIYARYRVQQAQ